ncbi:MULTISPECIES: MarR family winged helix-turn-helix transcriptional regulator [unclassified Streptomyces]|uniref:MarR family winged helix-turn-helix transcriptional regulator n=1 Tax=unclassified Streptomyces TaxID=2593676 RepID=UPI003808E9EC
MASSSDLPVDRLAVGQLLVRLLREFRTEMFASAAARGYGDLREPHLQIFGNVGIDGIRLTDLAARAQLSLAAASELVNELQDLGYLERRPDPSDRRAKLIFPTVRGRQALDDAGGRVAEIEQRWSAAVGPEHFAAACRTLQHLLDALTGTQDGHASATAPKGPAARP